MKIRLDSSPCDAPCCMRVEQVDGDGSILIQQDWDFPSLANTFGWDMQELQKLRKKGDCKHPKFDTDDYDFVMSGELKCCSCGAKHPSPCDHSSTDGTVDCSCGVTASQFIAAAGEWLRNNDGAEADDPGYFQ